jgi:putative SOS response-associated peptidase YedK
MCGRYYSRRQKQEIAECMRTKKVFTEPYAPDFNVAPTTFQPIVRQERDSDDELQPCEAYRSRCVEITMP